MPGKKRRDTFGWYVLALVWVTMLAGLFLMTGWLVAAEVLRSSPPAAGAPARSSATGPKAGHYVLYGEGPMQATPTSTRTGTPPTATPTGTATGTPSPSATPCSSSAIVNGGFETGSLPPWTVLGTNPPPVVSNALAHSGTYSALLGTVSGPEPTGDGSMYEQFTVPVEGGTLSYWWNGGTTDTISFDWQDAYITNTGGGILATIQHQCLTTGGWLNQTYDLAAYAGQTIRVEFLVHQDGFGDDTHMYVDDVLLLTACGTSTPVAPTATATRTPTHPGAPTHTPQAHPSTTPTVCTIAFSDVPPGSTFYQYVHCLACLGIINGYPDGSFKPNNNVTRGQLSKIVSNSAGFHDPQPTQMFQDVPLGSTFQVFIGRLASRGYINGYPCGNPEPCVPPGNLPYFRPNNNATRGQISKIVSNAAGFNNPPSGQQFQDVAVASTYYTYTYRLVTRGVMSGYPCGGLGEPCIPPGNLPYFRPNNNATRGQTSKIVANTFFPGCTLGVGSVR